MNDKERIQEIFEAVRLHLISKHYDYFKYNGKLRSKPTKISPLTSFIVNKAGIADEDHLVYYFLSNQIHYYMTNGRFCSFLPEIANQESIENYEKFLKSLKNIEVNLVSELETLYAKGAIKKLTSLDDITSMFYSGKLSLFTILHVYKFANMQDKWKESANPLAADFLTFLSKIEPFLKFKKEIFLKSLRRAKETV